MLLYQSQNLARNTHLCTSYWACLRRQAGVIGADAERLANHVIVAGGQCSSSNSHVLNSAEVWDPNNDSWELLPPMRHARAGARGFVLPGGRFAVVGGMGLAEATGSAGTSGNRLEMRRDTEVYDARTNAWTTLPDDCANCRSESQPCACQLTHLAGTRLATR